jgi:hypothetical protein
MVQQRRVQSAFAASASKLKGKAGAARQTEVPFQAI